MTTQNYQQTAEGLGRGAVVALCLTASMLLAACGGGSDGASTPESADGMKQALGVTGTTVPGSWKGRAPKMEVINGIGVPPEPAPTVNNSTLAGIDVNANGVRDDVERRIATAATSGASFEKSIRYANMLEKILLAPEPSTKEDALRLFLGPECALSGQATDVVAINYAQTIFNNEERRKKIKAVSKLVPAMTAEEVKSYVCQ